MPLTAAALRSCTGLQDVEEREPHPLLQFRVAPHPHIGAVPKLVQIRPLVGEQTLEAGMPSAGQRGGGLVPQRWL